MPVNFEMDDIEGITFHGDAIGEVTFNGDVVWTGVEIIDDFEDGNADGWDVPSSSGTAEVISPGLDGTNYSWELDGFVEPHLSGNSTVDRGPQPGDEWEFWHRITEDYGGEIINRVEFSSWGADDSTFYRIEWERNTSDTELSLERYSSNGQEQLVTDEAFLPSVETDYQFSIDWNVDGNEIGCQVFQDGSPASDRISINHNSSGGYAEQGIRLVNSGNNRSLNDEFRIVD